MNLFLMGFICGIATEVIAREIYLALKKPKR